MIDVRLPEGVAPVVFSVQLGARWNSGALPAGATIPHVYAQLLFGSGGAEQWAEIDVPGGVLGSGTSLNVVASSLRVAARDATLYTGQFPSSSPFTINALASPCAVPGARPTKTLIFDGSFGANTQPIPPFAKKLRTAKFDNVGVSNVRLLLQDITNTTIANIVIPTGTDLQDYELPNGVTQVVFDQGNSGAAVSQLFCIFELDLGAVL